MRQTNEHRRRLRGVSPGGWGWRWTRGRPRRLSTHLDPEEVERFAQSADATHARLARELLRLRAENAAQRTELADAQQQQRKLEAKLAALELEAERAHHLLDQVGLARELRTAQGSVDLSLAGRIELALDDDDAE